jgi:hypothetical protein
MAYDHAGDMCHSFFAEFWNDGLLPALPPNARVLELGSAEADWFRSIRQERPDLYLVGIDVRGAPRAAADEVWRDDILTHDFEPASFDAIVACSVVHWCGRGHYGDPLDVDGDSKLMQRARQWIKPSGWMYFDVAYGTKERKAQLRTYTDAQLRSRLLQGLWAIEEQQYFDGRMADGSLHPDGPYVAQCVLPV